MITGKIGEIMISVRNETLRPDPDMLESDLVKNAIAKLYDALIHATEKVVRSGEGAIDDAAKGVMEVWDTIRIGLGLAADDVLKGFQEELVKLFKAAVTAAAYCVPQNVSGKEPWSAKITEFQVSLTLAFAPTVKVGVVEWLNLAATGTVQAQAKYVVVAGASIEKA
jgi:hypothetical protein